MGSEEEHVEYVDSCELLWLMNDICKVAETTVIIGKPAPMLAINWALSMFMAP